MESTTLIQDNLEAVKGRFEKEGFCITPPIIPKELIERVIPHMEAVARGEYETGVEPHAIHFKPEDGPEKIKKVDQPHLCDRTILEFVSHPSIGEWAARLMDAEWVQVWAVQLLIKPPGCGAKGLVGWHQDKHYWPYWEGEPFTGWVAVSDVPEESGPVRYVTGSHKWGYLEGGDFYGSDDESQRDKIQLPEGAEWNETSAVMSAGQTVFHHRHTFHGSGPNYSEKPRISFAIHLRTNKTKPLYDATDREYYITDLDDPIKAPVIYGA